MKNINIIYNVITIEDINFIGTFIKSKDNSYILCLSEKSDNNNKSDIFVSGKFVLLHKNEIIMQEEAQKPTMGAVSDNGFFAVIDITKELNQHCIISIYNKNILIDKLILNAYPASCGISNDGNYFAVQLCNSENDDGNKLLFYDIRNKKLLWKYTPATGFSLNIDIDTKHNSINLIYLNNIKARYGFDGSFLDHDNIESFLNGYQIIDYVNNNINKSIDIKKAIELLNISITKNISPWTISNVHKTLGNLYIENNNKNKAIESFKKALKLNPKCGVKRLLDKLENDK